MNRDVQALGSCRFDLLVLGGGIYGAWVAYDASLRGLRVALVEKNDWGSGTSSASTKLIHGGLRYLEYGRLGMVRRALAERRRLWELGPHRVRPLEFLLPVYAGARSGSLRLRLGLWLYDRLGGGAPPAAGHRVLGSGAVRDRFGCLDRQGLRGGILFGDCGTDDARFTLEIVDGAVRNGVIAANHAAAVRLRRNGDRPCGAEIVDGETGDAVMVEAAVTVNCTGPWSRDLLDRSGRGIPHIRWSKGVHLVMPALPVDAALVFPLEQRGRVLFLIPWYGRTLLGTTDTDHPGTPDALQVEDADIDFLLDAVNRFLEGSPWTRTDIIGRFVGLRTLPADGNRPSAAVSREFRLVETETGLLTPIGGKFTSARADAARIVDRVLERLERPSVPCPTADRAFPWRPPAWDDDWQARAAADGRDAGLDPETAAACPPRHGTGFDRLLGILRDEPALAGRIVPDAPFCLAEVVNAVRSEMARDLEDILVRRIPVLRLSRPAAAALDRVADLAGGILNWSAERRRAEVDALIGEIRPGGIGHAQHRAG